MIHILIVDDSLTSRQVLKGMIAPRGYDVIEASDGVDGINKLRANPGIALIISDVNMPNLDGIAMCTQIFNDTSLSHPPIVMATTESTLELKLTAQKVGVVAWILKPIHQDKLFQVINKVLGPKTG